MVEFKRTSSENADFLNLIRELDSFLDKVDKNAHQVCKQYNDTETIKHVIIDFNESKKAIGCGD